MKKQQETSIGCVEDMRWSNAQPVLCGMLEPDLDIEPLMSLGVSASIARKAMRLFPGDVEAAADYCLDSEPRHKAVCLSEREHVMPAALTGVFDLVSGGVRANVCEHANIGGMNIVYRRR